MLLMNGKDIKKNCKACMVQAVCTKVCREEFERIRYKIKKHMTNI